MQYSAGGNTRSGAVDVDFYMRANLEARAAILAPSNKAWRNTTELLTRRNNEYSWLLEATVQGRGSLDEYEAWLHAIRPAAIENAYRLAVAAGEVLAAAVGNLSIKLALEQA